MEVIRTPITGTVWKIHVKAGDEVKAGEEVAIVESMKMEIPIVSDYPGNVKTVFREEGDFINEGEDLIELD
ncbi:acetyl-CoA carboxylase biotin carboxyl carrier protein subunit [Alteribacillus iranensis]|uniref:Acetyl-CoA carboxylase biotin carboxyl carrier protein n=1 Tax=Alteribacillus iranensis TaxID=930128 RepID=A0A1I2E681_9BACI|nr:acetyl-CoA carboxylase biotin carboxyl carrier protein subunit [Alteribacillus iranensis]SFE88345.1 acetyl-CoA carboxylase biotin carboxyl carrier protein [Alteribacillus iranensis]